MRNSLILLVSLALLFVLLTSFQTTELLSAQEYNGMFSPAVTLNLEWGWLTLANGACKNTADDFTLQELDSTVYGWPLSLFIFRENHCGSDFFFGWLPFFLSYLVTFVLLSVIYFPIRKLVLSRSPSGLF